MIFFQKCGEFKLEAYIDVDWANSMINRRLIAGYCTLLGENLVT